MSPITFRTMTDHQGEGRVSTDRPAVLNAENVRFVRERRAEEPIEPLGFREHHDARWPALSHGERGRTLIETSACFDHPATIGGRWAARAA